MDATSPRRVAALPAAKLLQKVAAEMVGTFALVFIGCGAIMVDAVSAGAVSHVGVSAAFGLIITVMIYATGHISGAHFNPAVTVAFAVVGRFRWREVPAYVGGQVVAAAAAAVLLRVILGDVANMGATTPAAGAAPVFALEVVLTFFLMFVITAVATDSRAVGQAAGIAIGGTVALAALMGGPISGASMNPARSLAPAAVAGDFADQWIYVVAPIVGATLGAMVYRLIRCSEDSPAGAGGCC